MRRIADRYIAGQMVAPFLAWMFGLLVMLAGSFLFAILKAAGARQLPLREVLIYLAAKLPWGVVMSVPMAFAFAACLTVNRMARGGEITALRVGGLSPRRLSLPVLLFGMLLSLVALATNEFLVPWATDRGAEAARALFLMPASVSAESNVFVQGPSGYVFYARSVDPEGKTMRNILVVERDEQGRQVISTCPEGRIRGDSVHMREIQVHTFGADGRVVARDRQDRRSVDLGSIMVELYQAQKPLDEMSARELARRARLLAAVGRKANEELHNLHMKLAVPMATLVFAMVAMPIIMRLSGSGFTGAMIAIMLVFAYYTITAWGKILSDAQQVNPVLGAWACNAVFALVGAVLLWRVG